MEGKISSTCGRPKAGKEISPLDEASSSARVFQVCAGARRKKRRGGLFSPSCVSSTCGLLRVEKERRPLLPLAFFKYVRAPEGRKEEEASSPPRVFRVRAGS